MEGSIVSKPHPQSGSAALRNRFGDVREAWPTLRLLLLLGVVIFICYLYVLPSSQIDANEVRIARLQEQKAELERQNAALLQEIARNSDIPTLEARARQLGMGPATGVIYLTLPSAQPQAAKAQAAAASSPSASQGKLTWRERLSHDRVDEWFRHTRLRVSQAVDRLLQRFSP